MRSVSCFRLCWESRPGHGTGLITVAVGLGEVTLHPGDRLPASVTALLFGGCALFLATFGFTRWRLFRKRSTTRLTAAVVVLAAMPAGPHVPGLAALAIVVTVVAALNVYEYVQVRRHGDITRRQGRDGDRPGGAGRPHPRQPA